MFDPSRTPTRAPPHEEEFSKNSGLASGPAIASAVTSPTARHPEPGVVAPRPDPRPLRGADRSGRVAVRGSGRAPRQSLRDLLRRPPSFFGCHVGATLHVGHPDRAACTRPARDPPRGAVPGPGRAAIVRRAREHQVGVAVRARVPAETLGSLEREVGEDPGPPAVMARDRCLVVGYLVGGAVLRDAASLRGPGSRVLVSQSTNSAKGPLSGC
jgi:hypothetical protein